MIKVFLVEDEILIRNGIKNSIEWEKEGYEFVGEASDGELALPIILKEKPDILITDIRMPFMDGLELSRLVKKELADIKILILSGYDEFEYAKEAIKIGVTEYLLKPISSASLLNTLKDVSAQIHLEREDKDLKNLYLQEMRENEELKKMKFFGDLISGSISLADAIERGKTFQMNLSARIYKIILFKVQQKVNGAQASGFSIDIYDEIENTIEKIPCIYSFQRGVDGWAFLLIADETEEMEQREHDLIKILEEIVGNHTNTEYFGGIGSSVFRLRELNQSFREADRAFSSRFTRGTNQIISPHSPHTARFDEDFDCDSFVELEQTHHVIEKFLNNGTLEEVGSFVDACFQEISEDHFRSIMMRQYVIMNIYVAVMSFCEKISADSGSQFNGPARDENDEAMKRAVSTAKSIDDIKNYISRLLEQALELRNAASGRRYSDIIETAKNQIEHTYMSDNISLNTVAAGVGMSPSYFSSIFSREMGKTFVEYLTEIRLEKAKELLVCSSLKTSEVGYRVGYKDPHYFSYIFKKALGYSPKEYRSKRKGEDK